MSEKHFDRWAAGYFSWVEKNERMPDDFDDLIRILKDAFNAGRHHPKPISDSPLVAEGDLDMLEQFTKTLDREKHHDVINNIGAVCMEVRSLWQKLDAASVTESKLLKLIRDLNDVKDAKIAECIVAERKLQESTGEWIVLNDALNARIAAFHVEEQKRIKAEKERDALTAEYNAVLDVEGAERRKYIRSIVDRAERAENERDEALKALDLLERVIKATGK